MAGFNALKASGLPACSLNNYVNNYVELSSTSWCEAHAHVYTTSRTGGTEGPCCLAGLGLAIAGLADLLGKPCCSAGLSPLGLQGSAPTLVLKTFKQVVGPRPADFAGQRPATLHGTTLQGSMHSW